MGREYFADDYADPKTKPPNWTALPKSQRRNHPKIPKPREPQARRKRSKMSTQKNTWNLQSVQKPRKAS